MRYKNAQDFARVLSAMKRKGREWTYIVLTFERDRDVVSAYRNIVRCWDKFWKRLERMWGKSLYIVLIEQHRDGYPHVNAVVYNKSLYEACRGRRGRLKVKHEWLDNVAVECGFGKVTWIKRVISAGSMCGYLMKLATEMVKGSQVPLRAPPHFRRLRASRGLLPRVIRSSKWIVRHVHEV